MARRYDPSSYDDHFCLKPPGLLWLAVIYLSRAFILLVTYDVAPFANVRPEAVAMLRGTVSIYTLVASAVAAPVLYALIRRSPSSTTPVRWIWSHGRTFLALAGIFDCAVSVVASGVIGGDVVDLQPLPLLAAAFDIYFLVYILATRRVRDSFADFPPRANVRRRRA